MSSYAIAENHNLQTVLWASALATWRVACIVRALLPILWVVAQVLTKALLLTAVAAGAVFLAYTFWVVLAQMAVGGVLTLAFAYAAYPRKAVRSC